jgi:hypothetical protein
MRHVLAFIAASLLATTAQANISPRQASSVIKAALSRSSRVVDKSRFKTTLGPLVKGSRWVRSFTARNLRREPRFGLEVGGIARGTINMRTAQVRVRGYLMAK